MLDKILEYQSIDREIIQLENQLANSKEKQSASEIQQTLKSQHSRIIALESEAEKMNKNYTLATKKFAEYETKLNALEKELESADSSKKGIYEKACRDFQAISNALEREITAIYTEVQNISREYEEIIRRSKINREKFDKFRSEFLKQKSQIEPKVSELTAKRNALSPKIESDLLTMYKQKSESHIFPVFVPLTDKKCGGCRMQVSASRLAEIEKSKYKIIECETCGRYIFSK